MDEKYLLLYYSSNTRNVFPSVSSLTEVIGYIFFLKCSCWNLKKGLINTFPLGFQLNLLEQNWLIPYTLGFDDNKVFKEQLDTLIFVQVCRIIRLRTDEEKLEDSEAEV